MTIDLDFGERLCQIVRFGHDIHLIFSMRDDEETDRLVAYIRNAIATGGEIKISNLHNVSRKRR